jgi:hypothetical protein
VASLFGIGVALNDFGIDLFAEKTSGVRGRSQTLCFLPIALWAERGKEFGE